MVRAIVGANWGDEGKGKITDMLAEEADIIVRFQGAAMLVIQLSTIMASLHFICCHRVCSISTQQVLLAMELP